MSVEVGTQAADIADITATGLQVGLVAVESFADDLRPTRPVRGILDLLLPGPRLFLRLAKVEDMDAIGVECIVPRTDGRFAAKDAGFDELGEPDAALRRLPVAEGKPRRDRHPIRRLPLLQPDAGIPGVQRRAANRAWHLASVPTNFLQICGRTWADRQ